MLVISLIFKDCLYYKIATDTLEIPICSMENSTHKAIVICIGNCIDLVCKWSFLCFYCAKPSVSRIHSVADVSDAFSLLEKDLKSA